MRHAHLRRANSTDSVLLFRSFVGFLLLIAAKTAKIEELVGGLAHTVVHSLI
jgi:hypothetical protein